MMREREALIPSIKNFVLKYALCLVRFLYEIVCYLSTYLFVFRSPSAKSLPVDRTSLS